MPRDDRQFYINEGNNLNHLKGSSSPWTKVVEDEVSPLKFMGILPQRVKLSKIYD
jgi:hypothetical protein